MFSDTQKTMSYEQKKYTAIHNTTYSLKSGVLQTALIGVARHGSMLNAKCPVVGSEQHCSDCHNITQGSTDRNTLPLLHTSFRIDFGCCRFRNLVVSPNFL